MKETLLGSSLSLYVSGERRYTHARVLVHAGQKAACPSPSVCVLKKEKETECWGCQDCFFNTIFFGVALESVLELTL